MRQKSVPNQFPWSSLERDIIQLSVVRGGLRQYDGTSARISAVKKTTSNDASLEIGPSCSSSFGYISFLIGLSPHLH